jgi:hypothetical protein
LLRCLNEIIKQQAFIQVRLFKGSATAATSIDPSPIGSANDGLIQAIADNFDAEVASPKGLTSTHSLALLMTQSPQY